MVGGGVDIDRVQRYRLIYVEHGAGQSYLGDPGARHSFFYPHADNQHPSRVVAYISPRESVAKQWGRPAFAAGCPALDRIERRFTRRAYITFHQDASGVCPEAGSARPFWAPHLHELVIALQSENFEVVGHAHPRDVRHARQIWENLDVRFEPDPDVVLTEAALLIADNTSLMYEAAALDIPVIALNSPVYRKHIDHGLRFWDAVPGQTFDHPDEFLSFDFQEYVFGDPTKEQRLYAACAAYDGLPTGHQGADAAAWLLATLKR